MPWGGLCMGLLSVLGLPPPAAAGALCLWGWWGVLAAALTTTLGASSGALFDLFGVVVRFTIFVSSTTFFPWWIAFFTALASISDIVLI
jgi:hypothetical protein